MMLGPVFIITLCKTDIIQKYTVCHKMLARVLFTLLLAMLLEIRKHKEKNREFEGGRGVGGRVEWQPLPKRVEYFHFFYLSK